MATNTAGSVARTNYVQQINYVSRRFNYNSAFVVSASAFTVGVIPAGATVVLAGVVVATAFTSSTKTLEIGTSGSASGFASALALGTAGQIVADDMATSTVLGPYASDTTITATPTLSGGSSTAGVGVVYVGYILGNDF